MEEREGGRGGGKKEGMKGGKKKNVRMLFAKTYIESNFIYTG